MSRRLTRNVAPTPAAVGTQPRSASRAVHRVNDLTTRPFMAIGVAVAVVTMWILIAVTGFDETLQFAFATVCAGITVTMVFVLQHTQRRAQAALQLKLDELVRAVPQADDHLIGVEASSDDELLDREQHHRDHHAAIRQDDD
jgi:low affinity Fe/Cu permease